MQNDGQVSKRQLLQIASIVFSLVALVFLCACTANGSDKEQLKQAYAEKCHEIIECHGAPTIQTYGGVDYAAGLSLVELIDFDNDGVEELLVAYSDVDVSDIYGPVPTKVEIWAYKDGEASPVFQGDPSLYGTNGYFPFIDIYFRNDGDGLVLLKQTCHGSSPLIYLYELLGYGDDGMFGDIVSPTMSYQDMESYLGESKYRIFLTSIDHSDFNPSISLDQAMSSTEETLNELGINLSKIVSSTSESADSAIDNGYLDSAVYLDIDVVEKEMDDNPARAKLNWEGKVIKFSAPLIKITEETVYLDAGNGRTVHVSSLPLEQIAKLNKGDYVTVIGVYDLHYGIDGYAIRAIE